MFFCFPLFQPVERLCGVSRVSEDVWLVEHAGEGGILSEACPPPTLTRSYHMNSYATCFYFDYSSSVLKFENRYQSISDLQDCKATSGKGRQEEFITINM